MSKTHRGKPLKTETPQSGRGKCPLCRRTGVKLLYEYELDGKKLVLCKQCNSATKSGKFKEAIAPI